MYVVEFTDGSTLECTGYEETDHGLTFEGGDVDEMAFAPIDRIRYVYHTDAQGSQPTDPGEVDVGGNDGNNNNNNNNNNNDNNDDGF